MTVQAIFAQTPAMHKDLVALRRALKTSYAGIAHYLELTSGGLIDVTGNTVRRWFRDNEIPLEVFMLLVDKAEISHAAAFRVYPWTRNYFTLKDALK